MLPRQKIAPEGHWRLGFSVNNSQGVRCGPFLFVSGQVDLDPEGRMVNLGDLRAQATNCIAHIGSVLEAGGADADDLVKLTAYYVSDGGVDESGLREHLVTGAWHGRWIWNRHHKWFWAAKRGELNGRLSALAG